MKFRERQVTTSAIATDAAHALRPHAEAMEASMAALVRAAALGGDMTAPRGTVRITASEIMGASVLPGILADIRFAYPEIVLELALNNRSDDLLRRDVDIAVRMMRPTQDGLVAKKVGEVPLRRYPIAGISRLRQTGQRRRTHQAASDRLRSR